MGTSTKTTGRLLAETLEVHGVEVVVGVPGIHALAAWDALLDSGIRSFVFRNELTAGFAADGYARASGRACALFTTTGPGALIATAALMEARLSFVPLLNVVTQIPVDLIGSGRGYLHEITTQSDVLAALTKWHAIVKSADELPGVIAEALSHARTAPQGPVAVEIPVDVLRSETSACPGPARDSGPIRLPLPPAGDLDEVARRLSNATRPVLLGGGGVLRSGASAVFTGLAERLDAPALTTYMGKGAISEDHPLSAGSAAYDGAYRELLETSDMVLAVGTELGSETTLQWTVRMPPDLVHVDVRPEQIGRNYPATALVGDAGQVMEAILARVGGEVHRGGAERAGEVRHRISSGLAAQGSAHDVEILDEVRAAWPRDGILAFDMTLAGYMAAWYLPVYEPSTFLYPLGSGTLGYAWPAALGAKIAFPDRDVLAVHGDGGVLYNALDLLTAKQYGLAAKLLVIDDRGYGILRLIQDGAFGRRSGVDLWQPDFPALGRSLGVDVREVGPTTLGKTLELARQDPGPTLVHLPRSIRMPEHTK